MVSLTAFRFVAAAAAAAAPDPLLPAMAEAERGGKKGLTRNCSAFLAPGQSRRASPAHAAQAPPLALVAGVRLR